jgi:hypothetical protein
MWPPQYRHFVEANGLAGKEVEIPIGKTCQESGRRFSCSTK